MAVNCERNDDVEASSFSGLFPSRRCITYIQCTEIQGGRREGEVYARLRRWILGFMRAMILRGERIEFRSVRAWCMGFRVGEFYEQRVVECYISPGYTSYKLYKASVLIYISNTYYWVTFITGKNYWSIVIRRENFYIIICNNFFYPV